MSACPQCGTVARPNDKFCNICGTPLARANPAGPGAGGGYGAPAPQGGFAPPAPQGAPSPRCQMGHEIAPGASYCAQGHPIALDQMQFANEPYGQPPGGYGGPPGGQPPGGYGAPPPPPLQYGAPAAIPPPPPGFAAPPAPGFGQGPPPAYQPAAAPPPYGAPAPPGAYAPAPAPYAPAGPVQTPYPGQAIPAPPPPAYGAEAVPSKVLRGFLVAYGTNASGEFWPLTAGRHVIGRAGGADGIDIPLQDPTISSRHGTLVVDGPSGGIAIEDTGSTNGTFVNDEHIGFNGRRDLRDGDRLRFGGFSTIVKVIGRV
ncbi:MAG TPA: FHA domain-containing protein [Polyangiaceae bacterium]|nr:FHA domain-containing protein [Polyangiaceae bacterium]